ncbi:short transient receptor potential channel 7-like isoform X2 [Ptychodera flava]|uniref:short transient receptor potential channel 7-like isoform X2 n=1 Tax=Ptychodera flava TaxID=63121 RepID=UPI00396A4E1A
MALYKESLQLEEMFLEAAETGDKKTIFAALEKHHLFNVNCVDPEGKSALVIAVENAQTDIVEILALNENIELGDALLRAVSHNFIIETRVLCESLECKNLLPFGLYCRARNSDFHPYVTPVVLAAQNNQYDILKLLVVEYGAKVEDPSAVHGEDEDSLEHSVGALNLYRALTSEAYITLTADDPIERAFKLSRRMRDFSIKHFEFRFEFDELATKCEELAADLLELVQSTEEQTITLTHRAQENGTIAGKHQPECALSEELFVPHKIKTAIDYDQKKFVAHAHCQHRLVEMWYRGLPNWRRQSSFKTLSKSLLMMLSFPILSIFYIFAPYQRPGKLLKIPYVKFLCSVASMLTFLVLLCAQSFELQYTLHELYMHLSGAIVMLPGQKYNAFAKLSFSTVEVLIVLWVAALTWSNVRELWTKGVKTLSYEMQGKMYDYFNLLLFWIWVILRISVIFKFANANMNPELQSSVGNSSYATESYTDEVCPAASWESQELDCLNSKLDSLLKHQEDFQVNITSLIKQLEEVLNQARDAPKTRKKRSPSPLKIVNRGPGSNEPEPTSEGAGFDEMHGAEIIRISLFAEGVIALAKTLSFLSLIKITVVHLLIGPMQISFGRMGEDIMKFMAIFILVLIAFSVGLHQLYHFSTYLLKLQECAAAGSVACSDSPMSLFKAIMALFWTLFGLSDMNAFKTDNDHWFTDMLGFSLYAAYNLVAIVVLLNILIAMMSNTYTRIEEDADTHWKFSRARLWISFYDTSTALSAPFNLLPSMSSLSKLCKCHAMDCLEDQKGKKPTGEKKVQSYYELMKEMGQRYAFAKLKKDEEKKDPLIMQLKRDLSGLRSETKETLDTMGNTMKEIAGEEVVEEDNEINRALDHVEMIANQGPVGVESFRDPVYRTMKEVDLPFADDISLKSDDEPVRRSELMRPNSKWAGLRKAVYAGRRRRSQNILPSLLPFAAQNNRPTIPPSVSNPLDTELVLGSMRSEDKNNSTDKKHVSSV